MSKWRPSTDNSFILQLQSAIWVFPMWYKSLPLSLKTPTVSCKCYFCVFCAKEFHLGIKKSLKGITNKTGYSVYLTEHLPLKCRELQLDAKQLGIKTVANNCQLLVLCPKKEGGVSFRPTHTQAQLLSNFWGRFWRTHGQCIRFVFEK